MSLETSTLAPADARPHPRWPRWKVALAYGVLFAVAAGSIWLIDGHVLAIAKEQLVQPGAR